MLPKDLIDIEIDFAVRASELEPISFENALYKYTSLYGVLFVPSSTRDQNHPQWLDYLNSIKGKDLKGVTYLYYIARTKDRGASIENTYSGKPCFIYHAEGDQAYLHFNNNDGSEPGPLSSKKITKRQEELVFLFTDIYKNHPEIKTINGCSWLYNLNSYNRLFPEEFIKSGVPIYDDFTSLNIWGQFLDSSMDVKKYLITEFEEKIKSAETYEGLIRTFPLYQIKVSAPVDVFYDFYKIKDLI